MQSKTSKSISEGKIEAQAPRGTRQRGGGAAGEMARSSQEKWAGRAKRKSNTNVMIWPTRPRCTASGLIMMNVRSRSFGAALARPRLALRRGAARLHTNRRPTTKGSQHSFIAFQHTENQQVFEWLPTPRILRRTGPETHVCGPAIWRVGCEARHCHLPSPSLFLTQGRRRTVWRWRGEQRRPQPLGCA